MKIIFTVVAAALATSFVDLDCQTPATLREYRVDAGESIVEFSIPFAFSRVKGRFTQSTGTILYDSASPANSSISFIIQSKSLDTGWPHRDEHLRTSDFFDVDKYPTIEFHSERLRPYGNGWIAEGPLAMHGAVHRIAIPFHLTHPPVRSNESRWMMLNAEGALKLARADFGILGGSNYNSWFNKARAATMGDSVEVTLEIEAYSADLASQRSAGLEAALERIKTSGVQSQIDRLADLKKTKSAEEFAQYLVGHELLVNLLIATDRVADAAKLARELTEFYPTSHSARLMYGFALAVANDKSGAAREYAKAKEIFRPTPRDPNEKFPQVDDTWYYMDQVVRTAIESGHAREAVGLAETVSAIYPETARAFTSYGRALSASGDVRRAAAQYAKALQLDPSETGALEWRRR